MSGGGNNEFQVYHNNRTVSFVKNSILFIRPRPLSDMIGEAAVEDGFTLDLRSIDGPGGCTADFNNGCVRSSNAKQSWVLPPILSARLRTMSAFSFRYGKMEFRAKLPRGDWMWPAVWLLPAANSYGEWPSSGEIDIVESRGNGADYSAGGVNAFGSTLHFGPFWPEDPWWLAHGDYSLKRGDLSQDFHVYGLLWNETMMMTYIDSPDNVVLNLPLPQSFWQRGGWDKTSYGNPWEGRGKNAPFDRDFFIVINVAVGGTNGYFPDGASKPWKNADPYAMAEFWKARSQWLPTWKGDDAALQIDWIRVSQ